MIDQAAYNVGMADLKWNQEKNSLLLKTRSISFEEIALALKENRGKGISKHPSRKNQYILTVFISGYPWDVPFVVEKDGSWFLKTAYPNRKRKI